MAKGIYYQEGKTLDYYNSGGTAIAAGTIVVIGARVGIVADTIAAGKTGAAYIEGVFKLPLAATAEAIVAQGTKIYIDGSQEATTTAGSNTLAGFLAKAIAVGDTYAIVKINASDLDTDTKVTVVDALTSESATSALSAAQGKVLKDAQDALDVRVTAEEARVAANQSASTEATNPTVAEFNALLASLKAAGLMAADS